TKRSAAVATRCARPDCCRATLFLNFPSQGQRQMRQTLLSLLALFLAMATLTFGSGHLGSFLSLYMTDDGTASWIVGFVMSGYYIGLVAGAWVSNRVVQRVGHI